MKLFRSLADLPAQVRSGAVTIGNFDGVHVGHAHIVERLKDNARQVGGPAVVFTFDPHPVRLLRPDDAPPPLTWTDRKAELLAALGVDEVIAYPTDEALLRLSPSEFFTTIVRQHLDARAIVEGSNFHFGRHRQGDIRTLDQLASEAGIRLEIVDPVVVEGEPVSSSRVRRLVAEGDVDQVRRLLTQPYRIRGMVVHGAGRGAKLGFATANVHAVDTLLPGPGVYAGHALVDGAARAAAINIGPNPTFDDASLKVEVHLVDWQGSLYGQPLEVDFLSRLRNIQRFEGVEALREQLQEDIATARATAKHHPDGAPGPR